MEYTKLGRTGLKVSRFCLGTGNFGPLTTEPDSFAVMDRAHELSINFFDTADIYGGGMGEGVTEQIIGRWFSQGGGRREKTIIATKVWGKMGEWANEQKLSALHIKKACEASLRRLKTDYIDLYQMHFIDRETPWEEIWQAFGQLIHEGKVIYIGSSNFAGWHIVLANETAKSRHLMGLVSEQCKYCLLSRKVEMEVLPACAKYGIGVIPWSPLDGGLLGGVLKKKTDGRRASEGMQKEIEKHRAKLEQYEGFCEQIGEEPANVALAWLLANPVVTAPIIGPRTIEQLNGSLRALELKLTPDMMKQLDVIFPGPGGHSPEALLI